MNNKTPDELAYINKNEKVWSVLSVLNVLHALIDKSNIKRQLEVYASGGDPDSVAGEYGRHSLYKMLGYFSLVGLLRLHSLLGDYYQAITVLENIELHNKKVIISKINLLQFTFDSSEPVLPRSSVPDFNVLLRRLRLHDDAPIFRRHPHLQLDSLVHSAYKTTLPDSVVSKRPD